MHPILRRFAPRCGEFRRMSDVLSPVASTWCRFRVRAPVAKKWAIGVIVMLVSVVKKKATGGG